MGISVLTGLGWLDLGASNLKLITGVLGLKA